jgi:hypothetical protein
MGHFSASSLTRSYNQHLCESLHGCSPLSKNDLPTALIKNTNGAAPREHPHLGDRCSGVYSWTRYPISVKVSVLAGTSKQGSVVKCNPPVMWSATEMFPL